MSMVKSDAVDSSRYIEKLEMMHASNKDFDTIGNSLYNEEDGQPDIYVALVTYVFSLFTDNGNLLFLFYGLLFGYFYANNIWLVLNESKGKLRREQWLLLAAFSFVIGFWDVNAVRMWTAAHVFFYGGFSYLYLNKKKGLIIAASSILIHFSFILPVFLLLAYSLVRLNYRFLYFFYIASFFIVELNVDFIRTTLEANVPDFMLPKVKTYFNDENLEIVDKIEVVTNWYVAYYKKIISYFNVIFISVLFFRANMSNAAKKLLGFSLLFLGVANIVSLLPSGGRFLSVAFLFSLSLCFIVLTKSKELIVHKSVKILSPLLILICIVSIRFSLDYFNITTLTNPIVVFFTNINTPIIDFIK